MTKRGAVSKPKDDNWVTVRRGHFSRLYFKNQEKRRGLDNLGSLEKNDYEGRRYVVPEEALNDTISFEEIDNKLRDAWQNLKKQNPPNTEEDIRLLREMQWNKEGSDYEYRFWLQNEVEKTWTGQRSLKILMSLNNELNAAQETWNALSIDFAKELSEFIDHDLTKTEIAKRNVRTYLNNLYNVLENPDTIGKLSKYFLIIPNCFVVKCSTNSSSSSFDKSLASKTSSPL